LLIDVRPAVPDRNPQRALIILLPASLAIAAAGAMERVSPPPGRMLPGVLNGLRTMRRLRSAGIPRFTRVPDPDVCMR